MGFLYLRRVDSNKDPSEINTTLDGGNYPKWKVSRSVCCTLDTQQAVTGISAATFKLMAAFLSVFWMFDKCHYKSNEQIQHQLSGQEGSWANLDVLVWMCAAAVRRTGRDRRSWAGAWSSSWRPRWRRSEPGSSGGTASSASPPRTATARLCRTPRSASESFLYKWYLEALLTCSQCYEAFTGLFSQVCNHCKPIFEIICCRNCS